ncbi:MAG: hypothetical protein J5965_01320 [Aeriscardovia sp.]|nr:hypothetical protein [Aeriscardovia sp.]
MTLIIVTILLMAYLLIATERFTNVNKSAVAIFAGTVGWVLYICWGTDYIMSQHQGEYFDWLNGAFATSTAVKEYIASNIFLKYVGRSAEIVLFLLSTMTIVEILDNNGCFDYISIWTRTRKCRKLLWLLSVITLILSANLDNFTATVMMLVIMNKMVPQHRQRLIYGSAIVVSANYGGAMTVIGDPIGLVMWNMGAVSASGLFLSLVLPCIVAWIIPVLLLSRMLPERVELSPTELPYRGDDTNLNAWQRILMLFVGIGGLWFIPTFHNITKLSPFLGALCVLSVLWVVNEIFNRKLMNVDKMTKRRVPRALQYGIIQMMLYVMGIMLAVGVVKETGALYWLSSQFRLYVENIWIMGLLAGVMSSVIDSFATAISFFSIHDIATVDNLQVEIDNIVKYGLDGNYWKVIAFITAVGGNILCLGSISGIAFFKMNRVSVIWYFKNVGWKVLVGGIAGLAVLYFVL